MEIKAKATYNLEAMKALTHLWMFKKSDPKKHMIMWSVLDFLLLVILIAELIMFGVSLITLVLVGADVFLCLLECYWYFILPKIRYNTLGKLKDATNEYTFYDDMMCGVTKSDEYNGESEIKYTGISKVYETSKYFFIYYTKNQTFIVERNSLAVSDAEKVSGVLKAVLGKNYIVCNY